jgi:hypothetical protein
MFPSRYIQYFKLPPVPVDIINAIKLDPNHYTKKESGVTYRWTDQDNAELNQWGQKHICDEMYFALQFFEKPNTLHKDTGTHTKLNYVISPGGPNILTEFYDDDRTTQLASYHIEPLRWHVLKADTFHRITGDFTPGQIRFSITARMFDYNGGPQKYVDGIPPSI